MNEAETLATWDLLKDLGFQPDDERPVISRWGPVPEFRFRELSNCLPFVEWPGDA